MKRFFLQPLLKGSLVVLPMLVTAWVLWSAFVWLNGLGISLLHNLHLQSLAFPGAGLVIMVVLLLGVGLLFQFNPVSWLYQKVEDTLLSFPLVKTLYGAVKDFANMFDSSKPQSQQVVLVDMADKGLVVGIITTQKIPDAVKQVQPDADALLTVYLPMSYMVGGYTVFVPKSAVTYLDWSFEDAMRFALTAGVSQSHALKKGVGETQP